MLQFTCKEEQTSEIIEWFVKEFSDLMKHTELKTLACDYFDEDLEDEIRGIISLTPEGFVFDVDDNIGEEPYGYVSPFFESYLILLEEMKAKYPCLGIDGYVFVNDIGVAEYVLRQRVHTTPKMKKVQFIDQLQCIVCREWVDAKKAYELIEDEGIEYIYDAQENLEDGDCYEPMLPSGWSNSGIEAVYCICSKKCQDKMNADIEKFNQQ